ncbi:MAG: hypothetical protein ACPG3U_05395 [Rhodothermales bacterium]
MIPPFIAFQWVEDPSTPHALKNTLHARKSHRLRHHRTYPGSLIPVLVLLMLGWGCSPTIAPFSSRAYELAVDLKVDALRTIQRAEDPFSQHANRVESLQTRLLKAVEYARGRPNNSITTRQWEIMTDPGGYMVGGFLQRWEQEDSLTWGFIREASIQIEAGFDAIIGLESGKVGSSQ